MEARLNLTGPFLIATLAAAPLAAQQPLSPVPPPVAELPGMGRPVDIAATTARRARLLERLGDAVVLIPAARDRGSYPQDNDFRQHNTFFYFSLLESPHAWIVLHARAGEGGAGESVLLLPDRDLRQEAWTGVKLGPGDDAVRLTGFARVLRVGALDSVVTAALARAVPVYVPLDATTRTDPLVQRLRADSGGGRVTLRNLRPVVDSLRVVKDEVELAALRRAVTISGTAHLELMRGARDTMWEYELEAIIEGAFRRQGADRVGYPSIVGCGANGVVLHYDVNRSRCRPGDLLLVDAAAEWGQYTADITRTFPLSGTFTARQRALYDLVLGAQQAAMEAVRPGRTTEELTRLARVYMRENSGTLCGERTCDNYFIHGLSHGIGMDVHDPLGNRTPLRPGTVFTIEPGIYLPQEGIGIRIEDDILVTATGYENLSAFVPRTADDIERLIRNSRGAAPAGRPRARSER
jgi:Xaa-Pro aminopeptidase